MSIFRNLLGEDLQSLNVKELDQLENQIEVSLSHIRSTKVGVSTYINLILLN